MNVKPIILWSVPRSASTAFERYFIERGDMFVFHEPYSEAYYFSAERRSERYSNAQPKTHQTYCNITKRILAQCRKEAVFIKDMAYHVAGYWSPDFLNDFDNTFIVREPIAALSSQFRIQPDFNLEESGYPLLRELFFAVADLLGEPPVLIETDDFTNYPKAVIKEYCNLLNIQFIESALIWTKRRIPEWDTWSNWHIEAINSCCIHPLHQQENNPLSDHVKKIADQAIPIYEEIVKYKIVFVDPDD